MPEDVALLKERLEAYRQMLGTLGMKDYQVRGGTSPCLERDVGYSMQLTVQSSEYV